MTSLPAPVESALGPLLADRAQRGFVPKLEIFSPESFGNFVVGFGKGTKKFQLTSDRGQFFIEGGWATVVPVHLAWGIRWPAQPPQATAWRGWTVLSSNHSLERSVPTPRAVPAVPLIGCTACPSTNGRVAAAQFNR